MKIQPATETTINVTPEELAILEFVMADNGEILRDVLKPMFRYFVKNLNALNEDKEQEYIKAELPSIMYFIDLLEANFQPKAARPFKQVA
jgi:hypothetical protein